MNTWTASSKPGSFENGVPLRGGLLSGRSTVHQEDCRKGPVLGEEGRVVALFFNSTGGGGEEAPAITTTCLEENWLKIFSGGKDSSSLDFVKGAKS